MEDETIVSPKPVGKCENVRMLHSGDTGAMRDESFSGLRDRSGMKAHVIPALGSASKRIRSSRSSSRQR